MVSLVVNVDTGETLTTFVSSSSDQVSVTANFLISLLKQFLLKIGMIKLD